ncbi:MAG: dUTP diphosphatase [Cetobacterium sp.]|nr:dUTP diphosphatase [Cetobacterium sp.]
MSIIIDLNCIKKEQERFSKHLETTKGIINQINTMEVAERQILALISEIYEVVNETKIHKEYDCDVDRGRVIEELSDCLSMIGNIANSLDMDLVINMETSKSKKIETQLLDLNEEILMLRYTVNVSDARRRVKELILPQFINIVFSLGFSLEELKEAYFKKMESNYLNPKFM